MAFKLSIEQGCVTTIDTEGDKKCFKFHF